MTCRPAAASRWRKQPRRCTNDTATTEEAYLAVIAAKTAALFKAA